MPNFITSKINQSPYKSVQSNISFDWVAYGRNVNLIFTCAHGEKFFLLTKKRDEKSYVVKGEKLTKPAKIGLLQKALVEFKQSNCSEIVSEAIAVKNTHLIDTNSPVKNVSEILEILNSKKWSKIFIEIGFGSGRHLLFQARQNSDILVVGIEVYKPSIEQVAKLAISENLANVALINTDARLFLSLIASNSIDKIFLHFPVPWDDAPHRRVVSSNFVNEANRVLKVGANFELRTDSRAYADYCILNFMDLQNAKLQIFKNRNLAVSSKYEDRWKRQKKDIYDVIFSCDEVNDELNLPQRFEFDQGYDTKAIIENFKSFTRKFDDYFLHIEEIFIKNDDEILLRVAYGAFFQPEHFYVLVSQNSCEYFIKRPLITRQNLKAHVALKEYLANAKDY
ncbi:MAG: tRNA (guanosine(46)-N7)-methyltransferase TrmB [Campylobacter sp.]